MKRNLIWIAAGWATITAQAQTPASPPQGTPPPPPPIQTLEVHDLDLVQEAWSQGAQRPGQSRLGLREYHHTPGTAYHVYTRVGTNTAVVLDTSETIESVAVGDPDLVAFKLEPNAAHMVYLRAMSIGADTDVRVKTTRNFYTLWVTTEDEKKETTSDLNVRITTAPKPRGHGTGRAIRHASTSERSESKGDTTQTPWHMDVRQKESRDRAWLATLASGASALPTDLAEQYGNLDIGEFDIARMRFDLYVKASSEEAADLLAPERVMHDGVWTWLDFGSKDIRLGAINEITDSTEASIGFHIAGPRQRFLVVHGVGSFTIRSGPHIVCIIRAAPTDAERWSPEIAPPEPAPSLAGGDPKRLPDTLGRRSAPSSPVATADVRIGAKTDPERQTANAIVRDIAPNRLHEAPYLRAVPEGVATTLCRRLAESGIECAVIRPLTANPQTTDQPSG